MENETEKGEVEAPLEGLIDKPLHLMSDDEVRAFINKKRELRESSQAKSAFFRGTYERKEKEKTSAFEGFDNVL